MQGIGVWTQEWPTGSAYIGSDKPPQDLDYLKFVHLEDKDSVVSSLLSKGWEQCGLGYTRQEVDHWCAYRRGDWNLILCWCPLVYLRWVAFTELAKVCGISSKAERIELCQAILEGGTDAARNVVHLSSFNNQAGYLMQGWRSKYLEGL